MKFIKIFFGFAIAFGAGKEYVSASRQVGSFTDIGVILGMTIMLILGTWLIGTGLSKKSLSIRSFDYTKFAVISIVTFLFGALISRSTNEPPKDIVVINNLHIPLDKLVSGTENFIKDQTERRDYCLCITEKLANSSEVVKQYQTDLEQVNINIVLESLKNDPVLDLIGIDDCMDNIDISWSTEIKSEAKKIWKQELDNSDFSKTNDVEKYCDCLLNEFEKFPSSEALSENFLLTEKGSLIEKNCISESKK